MISIMKRNKKVLSRAAAVFLTLLVWQMAAMLLDEKILLPSPLDVLLRLGTLWQDVTFWSSVGFTFIRIAGGFFLALILALLLSVLAGRFSLVETLLWPFMSTAKSIPVASFIILCLVWLTSSSLSTFISFLIVLPVYYTNLLNGIHSIDRSMLEMAEVFRVPWHRRFVYIWLPQLKPFFLSASSIALGLAWKSGIAAEIIGLPDGSIGEQMYEAKIFLNTTDLFAWTIVVVLISVVFEKLLMFGLQQLLRRLERGTRHDRDQHR